MGSEMCIRDSDNGDCHQLLPIVPAVHHEGVGQSLHNRALSFPETFSRISASCVWQVYRPFVFDSDVVLQRTRKFICTYLTLSLLNTFTHVHAPRTHGNTAWPVHACIHTLVFKTDYVSGSMHVPDRCLGE